MTAVTYRLRRRIPTASGTAISLCTLFTLLALLAACASPFASAPQTTPTTAPSTNNDPTLLVDTYGHFGHEEQIAAISATTGQVRWRQVGLINNATLVTGDGALYDAVTDGSVGGSQATSGASTPFFPGETLMALGLRDGATRWHVALNNQFIPFGERSGVLYTYVLSANAQVAVSHSLVVAFNATNGAQLWSTVLTGTIFSQPIMTQNSLDVIMGSPAGAPNANQQSVSALAISPSDGHTLWTITGSTTIGSFAQTLTDAGRLYTIGPVSTPADPNATVAPYQISAFDLATGHRQWSQTYANVGLSLMVAANGIICFLAFPPGRVTLNAIRDADGSRLWSVPVATTAGSLAISQNIVEVISGQLSGSSAKGLVSAYALATGAPRWRATIAEGIANEAIATNGLLFLATFVDGGVPGDTVEARDATTGALRWKWVSARGVISISIST